MRKTQSKKVETKVELLAFNSAFHAGSELMKAAHSAQDIALRLRPMMGKAYDPENGFPKWGGLQKALQNAGVTAVTKAELIRGMVSVMDARYCTGGSPNPAAAKGAALAAWVSGPALEYRALLSKVGVASLAAFVALPARRERSIAEKEASAILSKKIGDALSAAWGNLRHADDRINGRRRERAASAGKTIQQRVGASAVARLPELRDRLIEEDVVIPDWIDNVIAILKKNGVIS